MMMKLMKTTALVLLMAGSAAAQTPPPPPTVALTQAELAELVQAETTKALGDYVTREAQAKAKAIYTKVQQAFAPPPPKQARDSYGR